MTKHSNDGQSVRDRGARFARLLACSAALVMALPLLAGCSDAAPSETPNAEATGTVKGHGVAVTVRITPEMLASKPASPTLTTPEAAVRSYLDWISYAYRIGDSDVAKPAMSVLEEVRVNSYLQYNLQEHNRLIDQTLTSISFGKPTSTDASTTVLPATEKWSYSWVSAKDAGQVIGGPFKATYKTTYTIIRNADGSWVVDSVEATQLDAD